MAFYNTLHLYALVQAQSVSSWPLELVREFDGDKQAMLDHFGKHCLSGGEVGMRGPYESPEYIAEVERTNYLSLFIRNWAQTLENGAE